MLPRDQVITHLALRAGGPAESKTASVDRSSARRRRVKFLSRRGNFRPKAARRCGRDRLETAFAIARLSSFSPCPDRLPCRAVPGRDAQYRPRSAGHRRGFDESLPSRGWSVPWLQIPLWPAQLFVKWQPNVGPLTLIRHTPVLGHLS